MKTNRVVAALALAILSLSPNLLFAQGESAVPWLLISPNSRASSMGEAGAGIADDASAIFWNPAGLAFQDGKDVSLTHANWLPQFNQSDLFYDFLAFKSRMESIGGTIGASVTYINLGEFIKTGSDSPAEIGRFKSFEYAVTLGYATRLSATLGLGVNLRFIDSRLSPIGTEQEQGKGIAKTVSFDVGVLYKPTDFPLVGDRVSVGANLANMGPRVTYIDAAQADPLPTNLRLGFGVQALKSEYNNLTFALDLDRILVRRYGVDSVTQKSPPPDPFYKAIFTAWQDNGLKKVTVGGGFEYWYGNPRLIALRAGRFYENPSFGGRKFWTFGAGLRYDIYGFDFSYISAPETSPLGNTLRFSLLIKWGEREE
jgi:hypothetical protein